MRSFATVVLYLLASRTQTIFLLDEPEAFLHPPQARRLGEILAKQRMRPSQLFLATHSPDLLDGLLSAAPNNLKIIRLQRETRNQNSAKELSRTTVNAIATDPVMKFSSVLDGLFHRRVIICESDADCLFYSSMLDVPEVNGGKHLDVLFLQVGGKDRIEPLARLLTELGVTVDVVVDIDILADSLQIRKVIETLGGDWLCCINPDSWPQR